jgi:two-component system, OmpR family, KDP operon response regulator KdpE
MSDGRILVVDDEPQILRFLRPSLAAAGYDVISARTGSEALKLASDATPDAILLDLGLPDMDGKVVLSHIRTWSSVPIIVVSARDQEAEKIAALDLGADDYVDKPFGIGELLARLRAALRHAAQKTAEQTIFTAGGLSVDIHAHSVVLDGHAVRLTPKEFELLAMLVRYAGRVVTHSQILTSVWGPAHARDVQYLRVFVGQLRQKLARPGRNFDLIQTEPGIGYRLMENASTP